MRRFSLLALYAFLIVMERGSGLLAQENSSRLVGFGLGRPEKVMLSSREEWQVSDGWSHTDGTWQIDRPGRLIIPFTPSNRIKLKFEVVLSPRSELGLYLGFKEDKKMKLDGSWKSRFGAYNFRCGQGRGDFYSIESLGKRGGRIFSEHWEPAGVSFGVPHIFTLEYDEGQLRLAIDDREIINGFDQHPLALLSALSFNVEGKVEIRPLSLVITPAIPENRMLPVKRDDFAFHVAIDYPDDLLLSEKDWDDNTLRELVRTYARMGVSRLYWIDYLGRSGGIIGQGELGVFSLERIVNLSKAVPEPMKILSEECHRFGMEAFAIIKPFDMAYGTPWALYPENRPNSNGLRAVGGWTGGTSRFIREHPQLRTRLHPSLLRNGKSEKVAEISLFHWDDAPLVLSAEDFIIWISDDNETYKPYDGPLNFKNLIIDKKPERFTPAPEKRHGSSRPVRTFRFSELDIHSPYLALELKAGTTSAKLENFLSAFVEIKNSTGDRMAVTYGLSPSLRFDPQNFHYQVGNFREVGIAFDAGERTRYDRWTGGARLQQSLGRSRFVLEPGGWLGLALGRNEFPTATVDPSYPEVRNWIIERVRELMELGVDGVDFRLANHTDSLDWENYGFSKPVVDEFRNRYGVDITRDIFDRALWRKLRGEYIDTLLREISNVVHEFDGTFQMHVDPFMAFGPESNCFHETSWNWATWIGDGIIDEITLKEGPETFSAIDENTFWAELIRRGRAADIPVYACNGDLLETPETPLEWFEKSYQAGLSGIIFYESAKLVSLKSDGRFVLKNESLPESFTQFRNINKR